MVENNYVIKKSDVLVGSSFLKNRDDNSNRVEYMIQNIKHNKAYNFYKKKHLDEKISIKNITNDYLNYRNNWNNQPNKIIKHKIKLINLMIKKLFHYV